MATTTNAPMISRIRRKPLNTYKSPTAEEQLSTPRSMPQIKRKKISTLSKGSSKSSFPIQSTRSRTSPDSVRGKPPMSPPLPLFHPLGHLALSLPPLDPTLYGLPELPVPDELEERQFRKPSKKLQGKNREAEEEVETPVPTVSAVAAVAAQELKERASPRKRRNGNGGGGPKRKRKDVEDGDATYPAKRTRLPRGAATQNGEEDVTADMGSIGETATEVLLSDDLVEKRRTTRSRGGKGRESSESETTSSANKGDGKEDGELSA